MPSDLANNVLGMSETICDGWVGSPHGCVWSYPEDNLASQRSNIWEWRVDEKSKKKFMGSVCKLNKVVD